MSIPDSTVNLPLYCYRFGTAQFDEAQMELRVGGLPVDLEQKPLRVLTELLHHADEVLTRQELYDTVWLGRPTVEEVLSNCIVKLRKALKDGAGERIVTVPRVGYKLSGPVRRTAVGRRLLSRLTVKAGEPVPERPQFLLESQLGASAGVEIWLARHAITSESHVFKFSLDGERLASLKREVTLYRVIAESLGDRDDIVRIVEWNFETPPFFLESEYGGPNLEVWAAQDRRLEQLALEPRLSLFLQIAGAVAAAHGVGVLHKDLKPTNVLVAPAPNGAWQMRVVDFGSGRLMEPKRLEDLGITQLDPNEAPGLMAGSNSGTALYVAPELISGQLPSVQADVFALGLILFQMVIGDLRRPMVPGWERDVSDEILREDIAAATDGNPAQRLGSVAELVHRLQSRDSRLAERIAAREARQRLADAELIAQRTRAQRPWLITVMVCLVMGIVIGLFFYRKQVNAHAATQREKLRAEQINRFLTEDLLGAADPNGPGGRHDATIKEALVRASGRLTNRFNDDPLTKASIEAALGQTYYVLTDYATAEPHLRNAVELFRTARGPNDPATIDAQYSLALDFISLNRLEDAEALLNDTDRIAGQYLSGNSLLAFNAHMARANLHMLRYQPEQAAAEFELSDRVRSVLAPTDRRLLFRVKSGLSWCFQRMNRNQDAERVLRELSTPQYTIESVGPSSWSEVQLEYGAVLAALGRFDEAAAVTHKALEELQAVLGPDEFYVGLAWDYLGDIYVAKQDFAAAAEPRRRCYEIFRARLGEHAQNTLSARADLGVLKYHEMQFQEAASLLSSLRDELIQSNDLSNPILQYASFYWASAETEGRLGNPADAVAVLTSLNSATLRAIESSKDWDQRLQALSAAAHLRESQHPKDAALLAAAVQRMQSDGVSPTILAHYRTKAAD